MVNGFVRLKPHSNDRRRRGEGETKEKLEKKTDQIA